MTTTLTVQTAVQSLTKTQGLSISPSLSHTHRK